MGTYYIREENEDHYSEEEELIRELDSVLENLKKRDRWARIWKQAAKKWREDYLIFDRYHGAVRKRWMSERDEARHWARKMKAERDSLQARLDELEAKGATDD